MLTLATAYFVKVLLDSEAEGVIPAVGLWFIAVVMDFVLLVGVLVFLGG